MRSTLIDEHFKRDEAELPGLGVKVPLPNGALFRDEGEVPSLLKSITRTQLILNGAIMSPRNTVIGGAMDRVLGPIVDNVAIMAASDAIQQKYPNLDLDHSIGYQLRHETDTGAVAYSIGKKRELEKSASIFTDGYNSGLMLDKLGQRKVLQQLLDQRSISLDSLELPLKDFADLAGVVALKKAQERGEKDINLPVFESREAVKDVLAKPFGF